MDMFEQKLLSFFDKLGNDKKMVLATSNGTRVSARMMSCIIIDKTIYFQTDKKSVKFEQIKTNPNVALCIDNIQIEGTAAEIGHPLDKENQFFAIQFQNCFEHAFNLYTHLPNETLIKVNIKTITLWEYHNGKPMLNFFDLERRQHSLTAYFVE